MNITDYFETLTDPRDTRKIRHLLTDIIGLSLIAVVSGCDSYDDIEIFGESKEEWLRNYLQLPNGIPSHDTIERIFESLNPVEFKVCFQNWVAATFDLKEEYFLHIDGKSNRRSFDSYHGKKMLHSVNVFAGKNRLSLAQYKVDEKSNEITAIQPLLESLDIKGQTVTIDAMGCQKEIAGYIDKERGSYVLAVKDNQKSLHEQIKQAFRQMPIASSHSTLDKGHGRIEERVCSTITDLRFVDESVNWAGLTTLVQIVNTTTAKDKTTSQTRYFISNKKDTAEFFLSAVRSHWGIENSLHWVLDVVFKEDYCRKREKNAAENFNIIRKMALNIVRANKNDKRRSIKGARLSAGWNLEYLDKLLNF
jgi:predicted transposase YbfD/YdcC